MRALWFFPAAMAAPACADTPAEVLRAILTEPPREAQFAPRFLNSVPMGQLVPIVAGLSATIGEVTGVEAQGDDWFVVTSASHALRARISLDGQGQVIGLFFEPPERQGLSLAEALAALEALPGTLSYRIESDAGVLHEAGGDAPVQVGSAFKLGVLAALEGRDLAEVVTLEARHKSLPTGRMQNLPTPAPMTLHTATAAMIADSDNTATDLLLEVTGADMVADILGVAQVLSTRQFFAIKADAALRDLYQSDPVAAAAEADARPLPRVADVMDITHRTGLGWAIAPSRLCRVIGSVADHPAMTLNAGPVSGPDWARVAFKGGSEPGVLAFVHHLTDAAGTQYCAVMALQSDAPIEEITAATAWRSVLGALARETR